MSLIDDQIASLSEVFDAYDKMTPEEKNNLQKENNQDPAELEKWEATVRKATQGDAASIEVLTKMFEEDEARTHMANASTCNKNGFDWKGPLWKPTQRLWISHQLLQDATTLMELGVELAKEIKDKKVTALVIALGITLMVLKSKDHGCGIYIRWCPGPIVPYTAIGKIAEFKSQ